MLANTINIDSLSITTLSVANTSKASPGLVADGSTFLESSASKSSTIAKANLQAKTSLDRRRFISGSASSRHVRQKPTATSVIQRTWSSKGTLFTGATGISKYQPALTVYEGQMVLCFADSEGNMLWSMGSTSDGWPPCYPISNTPTGMTNGAAVAVLYEPVLPPADGSTSSQRRRNVHVVYPTATDLSHQWLIEDTDTGIWWDSNGTFGDTSGQTTNTKYQPALVGFAGRLFCAFLGIGSGTIYFCVWTPDTTNPAGQGKWSKPILPSGLSPQPMAKDVPALYVFENQLYMIYANQADSVLNNVVCHFDVNSGTIELGGTNNSWEQVERTDTGCHVFHDASGTWLTFQGYGSSNVMVSYAPAPVAGRTPTFGSSQFFGETCIGCPAIAVSDNIANCIWGRGSLWSAQAIAYSFAARTDSWMSQVSDNKLWSDLCIPGTHDSAATENPVPFVTTQSMNITEQLNAGIRYLDIRLARTTSDQQGWFQVTHGGIFLETFPGVCQMLNDWLAKHPTESIFMQIKQEDNGDPKVFADNLRYWSTTQTTWAHNTTVVPLGQLRGKIQILHRCDMQDIPFGIYLKDWPSNTTGSLYPLTGNDATVPWVIEDYYDSGDHIIQAIPDKWASVKAAMDMDPSPPKGVQIVYTSAACRLGVSAWTAEQMAIGPFWGVDGSGGINEVMRDYIKSKHPNLKPVVLMMDFPEEPSEDLIFMIIENNFGS